MRGRERKTDKPVGGACADKLDARMAGWEGERKGWREREDSMVGGRTGWPGGQKDEWMGGWVGRRMDRQLAGRDGGRGKKGEKTGWMDRHTEGGWMDGCVDGQGGRKD